MDSYIIHGDFCYSCSKDKLKEIKNGYLIVEDGRFSGIFEKLPESYKSLPLKEYSDHLIIPGLSDLHLHAPQYQFRGLWMDLELLDWLNSHTFPEEAKYKEPEYADKAYSIFVDDLLRTPTTRLSAFGTLHKDSTFMLMDKLEKAGLAGYVGKVNMDRNSPDILIEDYESSISDTLSFIEESEDYENIKPIITPRFIPSCTDKLLYELGKIARKYSLPVQSHLSENLNEIAWVKELVPSAKSYADAYRIFGLWGETKTIMAHCTWSDKFDGKLMEDENIYIAHCPDSNINLTSGVAAAKKYLHSNASIGLGTDIAAGATLYLTKTITDAIKASKLRERLNSEDGSKLTFPEAFYMASIGSGSFFGKVGSFDAGYDADFVVLDESGIESTLSGEFSIEERLERYSYLLGERPVLHKAVKGRILF